MVLNERVEVIFVERGARVVSRETANIGSSARGAADSVYFLQRALATIGATATLKGLADLSDSFTLVQNRLGVTTNSVAELTAVTNALLASSNKTRTSLESNAKAYTRIALATRELGLTQQEVIDITETLNEAIIVSGATVQEVNGALTQFTQALSFNKLRGQELNSILKELPVVGRLIADSLGITSGELLTLANAGKITGEVIVNSLKDQKSAFDEAFGKTVPTVSQAFQQLENSLSVVVGRFSTSNGITKAFAESMAKLAGDADLLGRVVLSITLVAGLTAVTIAFSLLKGVILSNPLATLALAVSSALIVLGAFSDKILVTSDSITTLQDVAVATGAAISEVFKNIGTVISGLFGGSNDLGAQIEITFDNILRTLAKGADRIVGFFVGLGNVIAEFIKGNAHAIIVVANGIINFLNSIIGPVVGFGKTIAQSFSILFGGLSGAFKSLSAAVGEALHGSFDSAKQLVDNAGSAILTSADVAFGGFSERLAKNVTDSEQILNNANDPYEHAGEDLAGSFLQGFNRTSISDAVSDILKDASDRALAREKERIEAFANETVDLSQLFVGEVPPISNPELDKVLSDLDAEIAALQLLNSETEIQNQLLAIEHSLRDKAIELTPAEEEQVLVRLRKVQLLKDEIEVLKEITGPQEDFNRKQAALNDLLQNGVISMEQFAKASREVRIELLSAGTDFTSGFQLGLEKIDQQFANFATGAEALVVDAFGGMEDALADLIITGKLSFDDLINSIISDLAHLASQQLLKDLFGSLSSSTGGIGSFLAGAFGGAAAGGATNVDTNKAFLVGEKGPELFVPPSSGSIVPNNQLAAAAAAPVIVPPAQVNVFNVTDPDEVAEVIGSPKGEEAIINVIRRNPSAIRQVS